MNGWAGLVLSVVLGLVTNECSDLSPWLAQHLVRWSARYRYADPVRATERAEELAALIIDRPGKLLKLGTALAFGLHALLHRQARRPAQSKTPPMRAGTRLRFLGWSLLLTWAAASAQTVMAALVTNQPEPWMGGIFGLYIVPAAAMSWDRRLLVRATSTGVAAASLYALGPGPKLPVGYDLLFVVLAGAVAFLVCALIDRRGTPGGPALVVAVASTLLVGSTCFSGIVDIESGPPPGAVVGHVVRALWVAVFVGGMYGAAAACGIMISRTVVSRRRDPDRAK